jgi:hypothetical protein
MRRVYPIQPYELGSKNYKSLALVIPAAVVKEYEIDRSTVFALMPDMNAKKVTIYQTTFPIEKGNQKEIESSTGERLQSHLPVDEKVQ